MKNRALWAGVVFFLVLIVFSGCAGTMKEEREKAEGFFFQWLQNEGVPPNPEKPMLGFYLGVVPQGSVVASEIPGEEEEEASARGSGPLPSPGWLFYLDEAPGAFYGHPGRIVVIGTDGTVLYQERTTGWPVVNDLALSALKTMTSNSYYQAICWNPWDIAKAISGAKTWSPGYLHLAISGAIVINGLTSKELLYEESVGMHAQVLADMQTLFGPEKVRSVASATKTDIQNRPGKRIRDAIGSLIYQQGVNRITIYVIAHGGVGSVKIGGHSLAVAGFKLIFRDYPDVRFAFILESCYSGNFVTRLSGEQTEPNVGIVLAACQWNQGSYADMDAMQAPDGQIVYDYNPEDAYAEWSSDLFIQIAHWSKGDPWNQVVDYANAKGIPREWALYYHAFWSAKGAWDVPPPLVGFRPDVLSHTITERFVLDLQSPRIYTEWRTGDPETASPM